MWHVSAGYAEGLSCPVALWCWHEGLEALSLQTWNAQTKKDCRQRSQAHMGSVLLFFWSRREMFPDLSIAGPVYLGCYPSLVAVLEHSMLEVALYETDD